VKASDEGKWAYISDLVAIDQNSRFVLVDVDEKNRSSFGLLTVDSISSYGGEFAVSV
jgi:hypothetical protein